MRVHDECHSCQLKTETTFHTGSPNCPPSSRERRHSAQTSSNCFLEHQHKSFFFLVFEDNRMFFILKTKGGSRDLL